MQLNVKPQLREKVVKFWPGQNAVDQKTVRLKQPIEQHPRQGDMLSTLLTLVAIHGCSGLCIALLRLAPGSAQRESGFLKEIARRRFPQYQASQLSWVEQGAMFERLFGVGGEEEGERCGRAG